MRKLFLRNGAYLPTLLLLLLGGALKGSDAGKGGKYCSANTRVQVVFVQDRTFTFKPFINEFVRAVHDITQIVQAEFPQAEFGYTAFADFGVRLKKHYPFRDRNPVNPRTSCYELIQPLTNDKRRLLDGVTQFAHLPPVMGGYDPPESSMTGLLYTAGDTRMNWSKDPNIRKIIVLITDEDTVGFLDCPACLQKPKPRGDGFDNCLDYSFPDIRTVAHVLQSRNFSLVGIFAPSRRNEVDRKRGFPYIDTQTVWSRYFYEIGVPYRVDTLMRPDIPAQHISQLLSNAIIRLTCDVAPLVAREEPDEMVQIVFVFDRTQEFSVFLQQFVRKARNMITILKEKHKTKSVQLGIAAFADFALHSKKGGKPQRETSGLELDPSVRCYERILSLTSDESEFMNALKELASMKWVNGFDPPESSMTALLYAATDSSMNWDQGTDTNKVLVLVTNEDTTSNQDSPVLAKRPKPEGNGFDTCTEHSYPDLRTISTIFKRERFLLVGLIARNLNRQSGWEAINSWSLWTSYFSRIGVRYSIQKLRDTTGKENLDHKVICGVRAVVSQKEWDPEYCEDVDDEEPEVIQDATKLQMVFVIERTSAFQPFLKRFLRNSENFLDKIRSMMTQAHYNVTEFGFTSFDDYDQMVKKGQPSASPLARISCYELNAPLSSSENAFRKKMEEFIAVQWKNVAPDPPQSSFTAMMYTATDPSVGWDRSGEHVKKILILVTNAISVSAGDAPGLSKKPKPQGDGKDTCIDHSFPDAHMVGKHLQLGGFSVLGLVGPDHKTNILSDTPVSSIWSSWEYAFSSMGIEYIMAPIPIQNADAKMLLEAEAGSFEDGGGGIESMFEDVTFNNMKAMIGGNSGRTSVLVGNFGGGGERNCKAVTKLQVVFVQDRSTDFTVFVKQLAMMSQNILAGIKLIFKNVEFGITGFSDFHPTLKGGKAKLTSDDPKTSCYEKILPLTSDVSMVTEQFGDLSRLPAMDGGDAPQSSMTALLYTAADKDMMWSKSAKDYGVRKVMILITNEATISEKDAPTLAKKKKPRGDGQDTCTKHSFPDVETTSDILQKRGISLIAIVPPSKWKGKLDSVGIWNEYLQTLGVGYSIIPLEANTVPGSIMRSLIKALKELSCDQIGGGGGGGGGAGGGAGYGAYGGGYDEMAGMEAWVGGGEEIEVIEEIIELEEMDDKK